MITSVLLIALPVCFGNWTANALVTERILQITFFCVLLIWQNPANMLNTNYLSFIYSFLLSLAFLLLMHTAHHCIATFLMITPISYYQSFYQICVNITFRNDEQVFHYFKYVSILKNKSTPLSYISCISSSVARCTVVFPDFMSTK